jgi:4-amino-4-deoxy-L-arabinose transferase-like glycosyltransferase
VSSTASGGLPLDSPAPARGAAAHSRARWGGLRAACARVPRAAWVCALVALANGFAWSLIVPPFEVPDENAHYAYVQQVAERGTLPRLTQHEGLLSPAQDSTLGAVLFYQIVGERPNPAPMSELQQRGVETVERAHLSSKGSGNALSATNNPPLYYALEAIPYKLASSGGVLDRLAAMRLLSVLMGAITVLLVYLFLAELLPRYPWSWTAGALVVAFQPLFGFMSGGVNNDNLLYLTATGCLWGLARSFRRGLTPANGALIGGFLGAGIVTKLTLLGFVPAAALAVLVMLHRGWRSDRKAALRGAAWAVGLVAAPFALYVLLNHLVWSRGAIPAVGSVGANPETPQLRFSLGEEISHIWQLYLPSIGMRDQFHYVPLWKTWFKGFIGRFGWLDYKFGYHFYLAAVAVSLATIALAVGEIVKQRRAFVRRIVEFVVYAMALAGVCIEVGVQSYRLMIQTSGFGQFEQARYMLPMIALYGAIAVLAVRFGGRRWGPALAALLVILAIGHDVAAQILTVSRYYT